MISTKYPLFLIIPVLMLSCHKPQKAQVVQDSLKLWYDEPANALVKDDPYAWEDSPEWLKALPLGNGSLGAMVFGDVNKERIQLNEESMWSGSPSANDNPMAQPAQAEIRRLLFAGKYKEATALTNRTQIALGKGSGHGQGAEVPFGSFQTLGDLWIENTNKGPYENYYRELNLEDATVKVKYTQDGVNYERRIFTSYPDQVLVVHFTADRPGSISFTGTLSRPERFKTYVENEQVIMAGSLSDGKGGEGLEYMARLKAESTNGEIRYQDSKLIVTNADEVTLYLTASTNYLMKDPTYLGRKYKEISQENLQKAVDKDFEALLSTHIQDHQQYYKKVDFDITPEKVEPLPTDERLENYKKSKKDPRLAELIFQYGRYLLISSSRPGTLPANLQGIWTNKIQTPWNGDYHTDVNVQMNYWPAEVTNLSEMHLPLFDLLESLVEPGQKTAEIQYAHDGWVLHPITNVWGYTSPGESASWGMHSTGGAWLSTHILEHFRFTQDKEFLYRMYPVLKGSVEFYLDWLVEDPVTGKLVSGPAVSPENTFIAPDGSRSQISMGPSHDQQVIWQLFSDFLTASKKLDIDNNLIEEVTKARNDLAGTKIGSDGRLMEWREEFEEVEPGHRHISHLFGLHPGAQFNRIETPKLVQAAARSLDYRLENGGGHTGWSAAWLISQFARLHNGERAKESLETVLSKSTSPNLFGQHPPFQIDANFGTTAGIAEMLLQSHTGRIEILPALPEAWPTGRVTGLRARGGYTVDIKWEDGKLKLAEVRADDDGKIKVKYADKEETFLMKKGETIQFKPDENN